jgi:predicted NUDIX family NTP pyrophosphohydrolase
MAKTSAEKSGKKSGKKSSKKSGNRSAGILMFRRDGDSADVLLVHPGGPFWANKDDGAWSIPKGLFEQGEDALTAAKREFEEETGLRPAGAFIELGVFKQPSGKEISAFAIEGAFDLESFKSNRFAMEWPPRSGRMTEFPEADRAGWFGPQQALEKIIKGQRPIVQALFERLGLSPR